MYKSEREIFESHPKNDQKERLSTASSFYISRQKQVLLWKEDQHILKEEFKMLFEKKFQVVEIRESGAVITHYLKGRKHDVKKDVETFKQKAKHYEMIGKTGMVVWA